MPTILRMGRFRFFFFSNEGREPPHIHVKAGGDEAKYWLLPLRLAVNYGLNGRELSQIEGIIQDYHEDLVEAWYEHFGT